MMSERLERVTRGSSPGCPAQADLLHGSRRLDRPLRDVVLHRSGRRQQLVVVLLADAWHGHRRRHHWNRASRYRWALRRRLGAARDRQVFPRQRERARTVTMIPPRWGCDPSTMSRREFGGGLGVGVVAAGHPSQSYQGPILNTAVPLHRHRTHVGGATVIERTPQPLPSRLAKWALLGTLAVAAMLVRAPEAAPTLEQADASCTGTGDVAFRAGDRTRLVGHIFGRGSTVVVLAHESRSSMCQCGPVCETARRQGVPRLRLRLPQLRSFTAGGATGARPVLRVMWPQPPDISALHSRARKVFLVGRLNGRRGSPRWRSATFARPSTVS